ncbi:putative leucine-rich repeat receptor-like serine/threonine-protein kinase [Acorus calamus]|uniref:non-specific serine/threonine protein kinase n=1 Tax=Acorus calamus TaxID=4465 RepID=A0AAV9FLW6_ACOCL|nr:putative leucine-rich repeat receptor-like serine/threonine-protein kinase [Acorus calamus]
MGLSLFLSLLLLTFCSPQAVHGNSEVEVLMEIKAALDPHNHILSSWTSEGNPCNGDFEGVACDEHGMVANLSLQGKGLSGRVPPAIAGLKSLSGLFLHYNSLNGEIPREIGNLTELSELYLNMNKLSGSIPAEIGNMGSLKVLQLCYNQLTGSIPSQLGLLKKLNVLALQSNRLTGAIPAELGDSAQLMRLDLSFNQLFGSIPLKLAILPRLQILDVRNNTLSGDVPTELRRLDAGFRCGNNPNLCGIGFSSLRACALHDLEMNEPEAYGFNSTGHPKTIPLSVNPHECEKPHCSKPSNSSSSTIVFVVGAIFVVVGGAVSGIFAFSWYRRRKQKIENMIEVTNSFSSRGQTKDLSLISLAYSNGWDILADEKSCIGFSQEVPQKFIFNLEEVESATQYFSDVNLLGKSSFGATYKGILRNGSVVAVKSINKTSCKSEEAELLKGLKLLTLLRNENIVELKGFCCSRGRGECFLIYDYVRNGCLSQYLDLKDGSDKVLGWTTRVSIIKGIAKGIAFLHSNKTNKPSIVHQNISSEKILIDQHFKPQISDSGLHKLLADDAIFSALKSSAAMGYLAPEYTTVGRFNEKSDVYAFGIIIFQVITGKRRTTLPMRLLAESGKLEGFIDEKLVGEFSEQDAMKLAWIALACTNESPNQRPSMKTVVQELS